MCMTRTYVHDLQINYNVQHVNDLHVDGKDRTTLE